MTEPAKVARMTQLLDRYGGLLTDRQRTLCRQYFDEDLSLAEVAAETGVSRQSVHDAIKAAEASLEEFERELHLLERDGALAAIAGELKELAQALRLSQGSAASAAQKIDALAARLVSDPTGN